MSELKAVPTIYKGIEFRSRLEARWAVFFDACGVEWEYEPEGFELPDGTWYLPDFLLHDVLIAGGKTLTDLWVEVKGNLTEDDVRKVSLFCGIFESWGPEARPTGKITRPTIILGNIPKGKDLPEMVREVASTRMAVFSLMAVTRSFTAVLPCVINPRLKEAIDEVENERLILMPLSKGGCQSLYDNPKTYKAYQRALSAKFEHGQKPSSRPIWEEGK